VKERGITLWLAALNPKALEVVKRSPLSIALGHNRIFLNTELAVETYLKMEK
jgi:SulP family sulfate permease